MASSNEAPQQSCPVVNLPGATQNQSKATDGKLPEHAQRVFARFSSNNSGIDCGAAVQDLTCKTCNTSQAPPKEPASCSYAASMPANEEQSSCPVVAGDKLHPLTNMPLAIYEQQQQAASTSGSSSAQPEQQQATGRRWWPWGSRKQQAASSAAAPEQAAAAAPAGASSSGPQLSTQRQLSTIPMAANDALPQHQQGGGGPEAGKWMYPSEQMFFNAMKRKGWQPAEQDMNMVVQIHNAVNERAWREVMVWESMHADECPEPKLKKFRGRPSDFSPRARILNFFGYALPFDRHDWVVDRCGKEVRYVIDFYNGRPQPGGPPAAMFLDVRPALDSFEAVVDRAKRTIGGWGTHFWG